MSPPRGADAASVSPYPFVVRQERQSPPQPSTSGGGNEDPESARPRKGKKKPKPPRPVEEEPRFNVGPRTLRPPQASRPSRFRFPGRAYPEDRNGVPDYPPPSFQEAINTPPISVTASTVSLVQPNAIVPLVFPREAVRQAELNPSVVIRTEPSVEPMHVQERQQAQGQVGVVENSNVEDVAETDDHASVSEESFSIIDPNSVPYSSSDLPSGKELRNRVYKDWKNRRGFEFPGHNPDSKEIPTKVENSPRNRQQSKPPVLVLDLGSKVMLGGETGNLSPTSSSKRRFLSLSPLRTLFPPKSPVHQDRAMSAHPSPSASPYSASRSTFFRSTSSLATSFLLPSGHKSESLSRKLFANKGKERLRTTSEGLQVWEVLAEETYNGVDEDGNERPSLMTAMESIINPVSDTATSPVRSQSFTFGKQASPIVRSGYQQRPPVTIDVGNIEATSASLSSRDWKGPSTAFIDRPVNRRTPISPSTLTLVPGIATSHQGALLPTTDPALPNASSSSLVLSPVRRVTSPPSTPPKHTAQVVYSSPLHANSRLNVLISSPEAGAAMHQRALETPLPDTPIHQTQFNAVLQAPPQVDSPEADVILSTISDADAPFLSRMSPQLTLALQQHLKASSSLAMEKSNSVEEPVTPTRHHYAGRPLPRPPPTNRVAVIDSTYAPVNEDTIAKEQNRTLKSVPEGLLIDLDDTTLDTPPVSGTSTPHRPMMSQNASSVNLVRDGQGSDTPLCSYSHSPQSSYSHSSQSSYSHSPGTSYQPNAMPGGFSEFTDLDLLVSGLVDRTPDGTDYESLLLLSELIGPASPPKQPILAAPAGSPVTQPDPPSPSANISLIGRIEVMRRRTTASGRVKVKLALLDVAVDRCGICLAQFRSGDAAALTSQCQHAFHEACLGRWLARVRACPICRVPLDTDMDTVMR